MKTTWKLASIFAILVVIIAAMGIFPVAAASETKLNSTLALTGATCASGDVKWETDGGYEYTDGSASISGGSGSVTITTASGFTFVSGCIKIGGPGGGSTIGITGPGTYGPFAYGISHVVVSTDPEEEPEFCEDTTESAVTWSGWTYSGDGLSRTRTGTITIYDANEPLYVCGTRQVTQTEYLFCTDEELDTEEWFPEGQAPEGSHIGACVPPPEYCKETVDGTTVWNDWVYSGDGLSRTRTGLVNLLDAEDQTYPCGTRPIDETEYLFCTDEELDTEEWFPEGQAPEGSHAGECDAPPPPKVGDPSATAVCRTSDNGGVVWDVTFSIENATVHLPNQDVATSGVVTMLPGNYNLPWDANEGFEGEGVLSFTIAADCKDPSKPKYVCVIPTCGSHQEEWAKHPEDVVTIHYAEGDCYCTRGERLHVDDYRALLIGPRPFSILVSSSEDEIIKANKEIAEWNRQIDAGERTGIKQMLLEYRVVEQAGVKLVFIDAQLFEGFDKSYWRIDGSKEYLKSGNWPIYTDGKLYSEVYGYESVTSSVYTACSISFGPWFITKDGIAQRMLGVTSWELTWFFWKNGYASETYEGWLILDEWTDQLWLDADNEAPIPVK